MRTIRATLCAVFRCVVLLALYFNGQVALWVYWAGLVIVFAIEVLYLMDRERKDYE